MKTITSRHNPLVKRYRDVAAGNLTTLLLLDGAHLVQEAIHAGLVMATAACSARGRAIPGVTALLEQIAAAGGDTYSVTDEVMRGISPVRSPSGIVALATRPAWSLSDVFAAPSRNVLPSAAAPQLVLVSMHVQDPGNVGAIVRAAEAGGASGAIFTGASADPFGWKALRGSMGSALRLPLATAAPDDVFAAAQAAKVRTIATVPREGVPMFDADLRGPVAILLGGEGAGLPQEVIDAADDRLSIPMRAPVESLNVAVAAALLVYETARQRAKM